MPKTICDAKVVGQEILSHDVKLIEVVAPAIAKEAKPGQFVNVAVTKEVAPLLRRPFGVAYTDPETGVVAMIYRIIGDATHILAEACSGDTLSIVGPLGRGFDLKAKKPLLVGGGLGLAPLMYLSKSFPEKDVEVLMGGRSKEELFWTELFKYNVNKIHITTDDGSLGTKGNVNALLPDLLKTKAYDCVYVCGPEPMMKAVVEVCEKFNIACQISLEKYMACGLGACLSCSCQGVHKRLKVCTDGPVFWSKEVKEW